VPLRVEKLFQEYNTPASFALASVLTFLALITLAVKFAIEHHTHRQLTNGSAPASQEEKA